MFIIVTRLGGRPLRVSVAAIAYVDDTGEGSVVKLIGGEGIRVAEDRASVEQLIDDAQPVLVEAAQIGAPPREMVAGDLDAGPAEGAKARGRRR